MPLVSMDCHRCGESFEFPRGEQHRRRFCSRVCSGTTVWAEGGRERIEGERDYGTTNCRCCGVHIKKTAAAQLTCHECCPPEQWSLWNHRIQRYGVGRKLWLQMLEAQDNACALCGESEGKLVVDHRHSDDKVRGILCDKCNYGMHFIDLEGWVARAQEYEKGDLHQKLFKV